MKTFLLLHLTILLPLLSEAHKVSIYALREGKTIKGECYFADGSPCKKAKIELYDQRGEKLDETLTDEKGFFLFKTQEKGRLKVIALAGPGHRAQYELEALEESEEEHPQEITNKALEERLQGLENEIKDLRKRIDRLTFRDIIGGIGYIFGLWGIINLLLRRKNAS